MRSSIRLIDANPAALRAWGVRSFDELRGKRDSEMTAPELAAMGVEAARRVKATGKPIVEDEPYDFNGRAYLTTYAPLGEDHIITTGTDITARRKAEECAERERGKVSWSFREHPGRGKSRRLIYDKEGEIVDAELIEANPAVLKTYGVSSIEELRREKYGIKASSQIKALARDFVKNLRAIGGPATEQMHLDTNGRDYMVTIAPIWKDFIITTSVDITDLKRTAKELEEARSRAQLYV